MVSVTGATSPAMPRASQTTSSREEFWTEDATFTLIEAWGERYLDLNRGNLRQNHWKDVAGAVNGRYENDVGGKHHRTDVQCKNRIDTLKKKYKIEKARVSESNGNYNSPWLFFPALDGLLNPTNPASKTPDPSSETSNHRDLTAPAMVMTPFPVAPRSAITRRPAPFLPLPFLSGNEPSGFRGNLSAFATAAAAAAASEEEESRSNVKKRRRRESCEELAVAIEKLGQIYERVEERKRKETVELEKQRMKFAKELECHRMRLFTEMQVKIHKMSSSGPAGRRSSSSAAAAAAIAAGEALFPVFPSGN